MSTERPFVVTPKFVLGVFVLIAGILLTLDSLNLVDTSRYFRFWPAVLIGVGAVVFTQARGGHHLLQLGDVFPHIGDLRRRRLTRGVTEQSLLAGLEKLLAPPIVEIRVETFAATQRRDALFASQPLQDDPDRLLR